MFGRLSAKRNQKGFTLMEMLIVVAIIAILVAVSIPIFTNQLEKSREATDIANMRAAKAEAIADYLTNYPDKWLVAAAGGIGGGGVWTGDATNGYSAIYNADEGVFVANGTTVEGYGRGTANVGTQKYTGYTNGNSYAGKYIICNISAEGVVAITWNS